MKNTIIGLIALMSFSAFAEHRYECFINTEITALGDDSVEIKLKSNRVLEEGLTKFSINDLCAESENQSCPIISNILNLDPLIFINIESKDSFSGAIRDLLNLEIKFNSVQSPGNFRLGYGEMHSGVVADSSEKMDMNFEAGHLQVIKKVDESGKKVRVLARATCRNL
jgi:hypothetical protein